MLIDRSDIAISAARMAMACAASRAHGLLAQRALATFGDYGPLISGCVREHFPSDVKEELRRLARLVSEEMESAYAARPRYVRAETIRKLGREIATRDGSGYYGPQPIKESN